MYFHAVNMSEHPIGEGLTFDDFSGAAAAVERLGSMLAQPRELIEKAVAIMASDIGARPGLALYRANLAHAVSGPIGSIVGLASSTPSSGVNGSRLMVYPGDDALGLGSPFPDLEVSIVEINDGLSCRYRLTITDVGTTKCPYPYRVDSNYTESRLAAELGRPRPLRSASVCVQYEQSGHEVSFDFASILAALDEVPGLIRVNDNAAVRAVRYFAHLIDGKVADNYQVIRDHESGARIYFTGVYGLRVYSQRPNRRLLIRHEGSRLLGPFDTESGAIRPYATFSVIPPRVQDQRSPAEISSANQMLAGLVQDLQAALWANDAY